jgi:hypothetical protein
VNRHGLFAVTVAAAVLVAGPADAAKPPATWDGLVQVKSKRFDLLYLQPGADVRGYTKVLIEPTEVAFAKNWRQDYNSSSRGLSTRISESELQQAVSKGVTAARDIFAETWAKGGYTVVSAPGPDVLRVKTGIVNIWVNAPDRPSAGRSHSFSAEAGRATLFVEARDSITGALLGRAVDQSIVGDNVTTWRTSVSNRGDFRDQVHRWASDSVRGMNELKSLSPITP